MTPEITVLMPNYNNELFLKESIDSILNQTYSNFIFLIIDDGSTDKSVEIINNYKDNRIKLILKESNSGIVDTLNIGINNIHTKYYVRMDGDDISVPNRIEQLYNFMEKNPEVGVCGSHSLLFGNVNEIWKMELNRNKIKAKILFSNGVSHGPGIYRTEVLKKNNIYYTNNHPYIEDYDLFFRLKKYTEYAHLDEVLYHYRVLEHNSTVKNRDTLIGRLKNIYKNVIKELNIDVTDQNIEAHAQFFIKDYPITLNIKTYKSWIEKISLQNKKYKIYPQKELDDILNEKWKSFFFKIVPLSINSSFNYFLISKRITFAQLIYLSKYKLNKLIGRNKNQ